MPPVKLPSRFSMKIRKRSYHGQKLQRKPACRMTKAVLGSLIAFSFFYIISRKTTTDHHFDNMERCEHLNFLINDNEYSHAVAKLADMKELDLKGCDLKEIPETIQYATNLRKLDVSNNPLLSTFPAELVHCTKLEIVFASSCPSITSLPTVLGKMPSITRLGWRSGSLTKIDPDGLPPKLVHLILTDNQISSLDDARIFEKLQFVRKMMLSHNNLRSFGPKEGQEISSVGLLQNLELLRLGGNLLEEIPESLWKLPRLSWLTISGNPVTDLYANAFKSSMSTDPNEYDVRAPSIKMADLKPTGTYLGAGASGKVESFRWKEQNVAVKLIHGVTSDGKAEDELAIYSAVGSRGLQNRVVGCLALLDDVRKGVVMEILPSNLEDFASPPTIMEVTKDRWDESLVFSASFVKNALRDSANALDFLHNRVGVSHGDFYAHNMKVEKETGNTYLLDFGASYFKGNDYATQAEKLEVRAFGIFVKELVHLLDPSESLLKDQLVMLSSHCMNENVSSRPTFSEILRLVQSL